MARDEEMDQTPSPALAGTVAINDLVGGEQRHSVVAPLRLDPKCCIHFAVSKCQM